MKNGYGAYESTSVDTADQGKLILIAYDVAIKHGKLSLECFDDHHQIEQRTKHLLKVQAAVTELMGSLKMEAGDIAKNLYRLYEYMNHLLIQANLHNSKKHVLEVLDHLQSLREAWAQAVYTIKCQSRPQESVAAGCLAISG